MPKQTLGRTSPEATSAIGFACRNRLERQRWPLAEQAKGASRWRFFKARHMPTGMALLAVALAGVLATVQPVLADPRPCNPSLIMPPAAASNREAPAPWLSPHAPASVNGRISKDIPVGFGWG